MSPLPCEHYIFQSIFQSVKLIWCRLWGRVPKKHLWICCSYLPIFYPFWPRKITGPDCKKYVFWRLPLFWHAFTIERELAYSRINWMYFARNEPSSSPVFKEVWKYLFSKSKILAPSWCGSGNYILLLFSWPYGHIAIWKKSRWAQTKQNVLSFSRPMPLEQVFNLTKFSIDGESP